MTDELDELARRTRRQRHLDELLELPDVEIHPRSFVQPPLDVDNRTEPLDLYPPAWTQALQDEEDQRAHEDRRSRVSE